MDSILLGAKSYEPIALLRLVRRWSTEELLPQEEENDPIQYETVEQEEHFWFSTQEYSPAESPVREVVYGYLTELSPVTWTGHVGGFATVPDTSAKFLDLHGWFLYYIGNLHSWANDVELYFAIEENGRWTVAQFATYKIADPVAWNEGTREVTMGLAHGILFNNIGTEITDVSEVLGQLLNYGKFPICTGQVDVYTKTLFKKPETKLATDIVLAPGVDYTGPLPVEEGIIPGALNEDGHLFYVQEIVSEGNQQGLAIQGVVDNGLLVSSRRNIPTYTGICCYTYEREAAETVYGPDLETFVPNSVVLTGTRATVRTPTVNSQGVISWDLGAAFTEVPYAPHMYINGLMFRRKRASGGFELDFVEVTARIERQVGNTLLIKDVRTIDEVPFKVGDWQMYYIKYIWPNRAMIPNTLQVKSAPRVWADKSPSDGIIHYPTGQTVPVPDPNGGTVQMPLSAPRFVLPRGTVFGIPHWIGLRIFPLCGFAAAIPTNVVLTARLPDGSIYRTANVELVRHFGAGVWNVGVVSSTPHPYTAAAISLLSGVNAPIDSYAAVVIDDHLANYLFTYFHTDMSTLDYSVSFRASPNSDNAIVSYLFAKATWCKGYFPPNDGFETHSILYEGGSAEQFIPTLLTGSGKMLTLLRDGTYSHKDLLSEEAEEILTIRDDDIDDGSIEITFDEDASAKSSWRVINTLVPWNITSSKETVTDRWGYAEETTQRIEFTGESRTWLDVFNYWKQYHSSKWVIVKFTTYVDVLLRWPQLWLGNKVQLQLQTPINFETENTVLQNVLRHGVTDIYGVVSPVTFANIDLTGRVTALSVDPQTWKVQVTMRTTKTQGELFN